MILIFKNSIFDHSNNFYGWYVVPNFHMEGNHEPRGQVFTNAT